MATAADSQVRILPLSARSEVAQRTLEFRFAKPRSMTFRAGQFMDLTLLDPSETDAEGNTRGFSINSAPDDRELIFTTRLRDIAFKRVLRGLPLGTGVQLDGPFGSFTLDSNESRPAVLLAGRNRGHSVPELRQTSGKSWASRHKGEVTIFAFEPVRPVQERRLLGASESRVGLAPIVVGELLGRANFAGEDEIATPGKLESWMRARRLAGRASRVVHEQALHLRTALRTFLRIPPEERAGSSTAVDDLNAASEAFPLVVNLADGEMTLQPVGGSTGLGQVVAQLHALAATQQLDRLKMCASDECGWIFFDQSKPANRRWCSSARCGNRFKTRSYRERRRVNEGVSPRTRS